MIKRLILPLIIISCSNLDNAESIQQKISEKFWLEDSKKTHIIYIDKDSFLFELWNTDSCVGFMSFGDVVSKNKRKINIYSDSIIEVSNYWKFDKYIDKKTTDSLVLRDMVYNSSKLYLNVDLYSKLCCKVKKALNNPSRSHPKKTN
jgi:hypothetical protein